MASNKQLDPISRLAQAVNAAIEKNDAPALLNLVSAADALYKTQTHHVARASIAFSRANAHSALRHIATRSGPTAAWEWDGAETKQEVYWLRTALADLSAPDTAGRNRDLHLRIQTNLANALNSIGRFCEAIEHWDGALAIEPAFGMAAANRGYGLTWYGRSLYDSGHKAIFYWQAWRGLTRGLETGIEAHARGPITEAWKQVNALHDWPRYKQKLDGFSMGRTAPEQRYRQWCLNARLFLNPLNDLGPHDIAARDVITFPSIAVPKDVKGPLVPEVYGIYNQLSQEFISARYMTYEALNASKARRHFSDRGVLLYDTLDYRVLHLWVEKLKMSFIAAFAVLEKCAFLINHHWALGLKSQHVSFGTLWFVDRNPAKGLRAEFHGDSNWPMRGLFALSRDLYWRAEGDFTTEPEARMLHHIRTHIAHKYLSVHNATISGVTASPPRDGVLSFRISDEELARATIKLLKLVRSALIYLSLGAHRHEQKRRPPGGKDQYAEIPLCPMGDDRV